MLPLCLIAAVADNNVIGINNQLPWHLPADLHHFKVITNGKPVIMGRKTWQSLGKPLPYRLNIVVSRQMDFSVEGAEVYSNLDKAMTRANGWAKQQRVTELMLIGGAQLYQEALTNNLVSKLYLTRVHLSPKGDTWFPLLDKQNWQKVNTQEFIQEDNRPAYSIEVWSKVN